MVERQITNFPDLKEWLSLPGLKLYILDELGKHAKKMRFMTEQNQMLMEIIQLIRHFDAGFIGMAPSGIFIDNAFLNTDVLDARIKKLNKTKAIIKDYLENSTYFLSHIPRTSIKFNSKDIAAFSMKRSVSLKELPECCQMARLYVQTHNYVTIADQYGLKPEQVKRKIIEHLKHADSQFTVTQGG